MLIVLSLIILIRRYTILSMVITCIGRIVPFFIIFYDLKFTYGLMLIVLSNTVAVAYYIYYPYMFRMFPRRIGNKLNQSHRLAIKLIRKKQYFDAYNQIESLCLYILNLMENKTENQLSDFDIINLAQFLYYNCALIGALSVTFSSIGKMDYASLLVENRRKFMLESDTFAENLFGWSDEDKKLIHLLDTITDQLIIGNNKTEVLKLIPEFERELKVLAKQYPGKYENSLIIFKPLIEYSIPPQKEISISQISQKRMDLLEEAIKAFGISERSNIIYSIIYNSYYLMYSFESAKLALHDGMKLMRDAKFSEAKYSFKKAERIIKKAEKFWGGDKNKYSIVSNSGKFFLNTAIALYNFAECRVDSDAQKFCVAKKLLLSTSKSLDDAKMIESFSSVIDFFDASANMSAFSDEFRNVSNQIDRNLMILLTNIIDPILISGFQSDKLSIPIDQIQSTSELNRQFIVQGIGLILMVVGIIAQQSLIVLSIVFFIGIILLNIGFYLTLKKRSI